MNAATVTAARKEADRFIEAAKRVEALGRNDPARTMLFLGSPETATLRRRSMDLTRCLAELRRHS